MGHCYSGMESLKYGNENSHACRKGKCESDHHYRSTEANQSRRQKTSAAFRLSLISGSMGSILKVWVIHGQYVIREFEMRCQLFFIVRHQGLNEFRFV